MTGSVNTNIGAQIALQNLNVTGSDLAISQKRISTGLRVSDALDNGAVFAIAQGLRSDISAITTVNGQLGAAKGALSVATAAATGVSNTLIEIRSVLVQLADQNVTGNARVQLNAQYTTLFDAVTNYVGGSLYNGSSLLYSISAAGGTSSAVSHQTKFAPGVYDNYQPGVTFSFLAPANSVVIQDVSANQFTIQAQDLQSYVINKLTNVTDATGASILLAGNFASAQNFVGTALNSFAASTKFLDNQITFNTSLSDATTQGLGSLVDADLAKESARLQSLQIKQQLGTQSLGIANQTPQSLLALFR
jgi:flagellin